MYPMTPYLPWKDRIRLAWAILRAKVYVYGAFDHLWGQQIELRTRDDERVL